MNKQEIPEWVINYNNANHQSSAGKAINITMTLVKQLQEENDKLRQSVKELIDLSELLLRNNEQLSQIVKMRSAYITEEDIEQQKLILEQAKKLLEDGNIQANT